MEVGRSLVVGQKPGRSGFKEISWARCSDFGVTEVQSGYFNSYLPGVRSFTRSCDLHHSAVSIEAR
jgi:hypothetical protein